MKVLLIIITIIIYAVFLPYIRQSKALGWILFFGLTVILSIAAYKARPLWDLSRHFEYMEMIRESRKSYIELIDEPIYEYSHNRYFLVFNLLCYWISQMGNFHLLPSIFVLADYLIWSYITIDYLYYHKSRHNLYFITIIMTAMFMPYFHALSGMRNAAAASLSGLGIYLYLEKKKNMIIFWILSLVAILIHPTMVITVPIVLLSQRILTRKIVLFVVLAVINVERAATWLSYSSISFVKMLGEQYLRFSADNQYRNSRRYLYADLLFIFMILVCYVISKKKEKELSKLENFLILYSIFILGQIGNYDLVIRPAYVLGPLAAPVAVALFNRSWKIDNKIEKCLKFTLYLSLCGISLWVVQDYVSILILEYF